MTFVFCTLVLKSHFRYKPHNLMRNRKGSGQLISRISLDVNKKKLVENKI